MKRVINISYLILLLVMLYAPIVIIAIFSFTESKVLGNWTGFSTELYASLFNGGVRYSLLDAIKNTFIIAFTAATVSTMLGTVAAIGIHDLRYANSPKWNRFMLVFIAPCPMPGVGVADNISPIHSL